MRELLPQDGDLLVGSEITPGGVIVYYADGDEEILHANSYVIDLFECDSFEDFMELTGGSFRGFVYARDIDNAEDSIWGQVAEDGGLDHIYYQIRTKSGRLVSIDDYGRLVRREGERPVFVVFVIEVDAKNSLDWLTGLPSVDRFTYLADLEAAAEQERDCALAIASFDLMGMRVYNARHGRDEGDALLRSFAIALTAHFGSESCCRVSGDSFYAFDHQEGLDERIAAVFADFARSDHPEILPVMAGVYVLHPEDDISLAMDRARYACDSDSTTWESHVTWYSEEMRVEALMRVHILEHVDQAITEGWIRPYYQSVVRAASEAICHEEALARWVDPEFGPLSPAQFIPVLEEAGLLIKLDLHIVDCVLADLNKRIQLSIPVVPVSVNISLNDLGRVDIASEVIRRVDAAQIPHELIRIEFTESCASNDPDLLLGQIRSLHAAGFEVWMDDFGSGYSSLNTIGHFDFDLIKLDMEFIKKRRGVGSDIIIDGVIRASKRMGRRTLSEGVETEEQAMRLAGLGCDLLQGYRYSRPKPLDDLIDEYRTQTSLPYEPISENDYWNAVGSVSFPDIASNGEGKGVSEKPVAEFPAGVIELRGGACHVLRANDSFREFLDQNNVLPLSAEPLTIAHRTIELDEYIRSAMRRSDISGTWERISGSLEHGSGFQFHISPLAWCEAARAYVITSTPTLLGSALGTYGDVPVAYAVLHVLPSEEDGTAADVEFVYANQRFKEWSGFGVSDYTGRRLTDIAGEHAQRWMEPCYQAAMEGVAYHDVSYGSTAGHWLSIDIAPSSMEDHCVFAFTLADAEQQEREQLRHAGTYDKLTGLLNRRGFDEALLERIFETGQRPFVLALLSVNDFKTINSLYGHDVGDACLRTIAGVLLHAFPPGSLIARNAGDELVAAVFGSAINSLDAMLDRLSSTDISCEYEGRSYPLALSVGYAHCDGTSSGLKLAYTHADQALRTVRSSGRPGHLLWAPAMGESPRRQLLGFTTRELAEGMPLAMLAHRPDGEILFANKGLARVLGYDSLDETLVAIGHSLRGIVHPDDWHHLDLALEQMSASDTVGSEHNVGFRAVMASGDVVQIAYRARLVDSDDRGRIFYAYMVDTDVAN